MTALADAGSDRGAAAVELGLLLPILAMILMGILEFGRAYQTKVTLTGAVRDGVRAYAIGGGDPVAVTTASSGMTGINVSCTPSGCGACTPGTTVSVTATTPVSYTIPMFKSGTWTITAKAQMQCGV